jgi:hypothetical protein
MMSSDTGGLAVTRPPDLLGGQDAKETSTELSRCTRYEGKNPNLEKARSIVERVGLDATNELGDTPVSVAAGPSQSEFLDWLSATRLNR